MRNIYYLYMIHKISSHTSNAYVKLFPLTTLGKSVLNLPQLFLIILNLELCELNSMPIYLIEYVLPLPA